MPDLSIKTATYIDENGKRAVVAYHLDSKRERFALLLASGTCSQLDAYVQAYERPAPVSDEERKAYAHIASTVAHETSVVLRVQELKKPVIRKIRRKLEYSLQKALEQCETAHDLAYEQGNAGLMLKAVEMQAKLSKLLSEDINVTHRYGLLDDADTAVLLEMKQGIEVRQAKRKQLTHVKVTGVETVPSDPRAPSEPGA